MGTKHPSEGRLALTALQSILGSGINWGEEGRQ